ncbi:MAG: helix-turn-helix transcriptional regulator [Chthoniobacteraceae bacterium]
MKPLPAILAEFRARCRTDADAATALGITVTQLQSWLRCETRPRALIRDAIAREIRDGRDPRVDLTLTPAQLAARLKTWRATHGVSQAQAGLLLRLPLSTIAWLENGGHVPAQPALAEVLHRLDQSVDAFLIATFTPAQLIEPAIFAGLLREWRHRHSLTQAQACVALGLPRDQAIISDWERGDAFPRCKRLRKILAALQHPPATGRGTHRWFTARVTSFGPRLRAWRKARGLKQLDAAIALGLPRDQALISDYEKGKACPRGARLAQIEAMIGGAK